MLRMELDFNNTLPAIWLVFGGTYLNHVNAPKCEPDHREQVLVDLLCSFLKSELVRPSLKLLRNTYTQAQLTSVCDLLKLWSQDLDYFYRIREGAGDDSLINELAERFSKRVESFKDCMIIPNGLISALHTGEAHAESVSVGILNKDGGYITWTQVDPGSAYHQHCEHIAGEKSNAYLKIQEIDPKNITKNWLCLLVGLKANRLPEKLSYRDVSLYEGLLSHLNGKTVFQSEADEGFIVYPHLSPAHTWLVVDQSFRFLLSYFLGETYQVFYQQLVVNFKLYLMKETLAVYCDHFKGGELAQQCHFLLQEMYRDVAQYALDYGNEEQKESSLQLSNDARKALEEFRNRLQQILLEKSQFNKLHITSLKFDPPHLPIHTPSSRTNSSPKLQADPVFVTPRKQEDINDYLERLKSDFIYKLINVNGIHGIALLSYGIETFFIKYLANSSILKPTSSPFSRDDALLAESLEELGGIYYGCQSRLVTDFLSNTVYQPQFYAKNVLIQFFVYAAVAALNCRDPIIGPLLKCYNLSVDSVGSFKLNYVIPQLVIEDSRWIKLWLATQDFFRFFTQKEKKVTLFGSKRFAYDMQNDANHTDTDVQFAYHLLQRYPSEFRRFSNYHLKLEDEKASYCWSWLAYTDDYLPTLYHVLSKVVNLAKVSLTGFPPCTNKNRVKTDWLILSSTSNRPPFNFYTKVIFKINHDSHIRVEPYPKLLTSFSIKCDSKYGKDPYQKLITCKEEEDTGKLRCHFLENEIIAHQNSKPDTMGSSRYMQLGFLQSEPQIKLERLYIALKEKQIDFSRNQESILIQQTVFEISLFLNIDDKPCSLLEWTVHQNPVLIHEFGLLCIEKALAMRFRLSQHHVIGDILVVCLGLRTFYPAEFRDDFINGIIDIYNLLKDILTDPSDHLSANILLHLNAYLIITIQVKPQMLETETLTILKALVAIKNFETAGLNLDNSWLLRVHVASFTFSSWIEDQLVQNPSLLNDLMLTVVPDWDCSSSWEKSEDGVLFTSNNYSIKPLSGCIFFNNLPDKKLPLTISGHSVFKDYLGEESFSVQPGSYLIGTQKVACYHSVKRKPPLRLTLIEGSLLIEEQIPTGEYHCFIPVQELLEKDYPRFLLESSHNKGKLRHWKYEDTILIKNEKRWKTFQWDLNTNFLFSMEHTGFVVPWKNIKPSDFKTHLEDIESSDWIQLIAGTLPNSDIVFKKSLNFSRLGLHFKYDEGQFLSKQIHGYIIAKQQRLNTLQGFNNYLVLELNEQNSVRKRMKVIVPHRKVLPKGQFYVNTIGVDRHKLRTPAYFVYDYDSMMGMLKGHHIRAHLYLALLYFRSASFDEDDLSNCNAYHLARQNLELCWKDQPYDNIELDIIEQLLDVSQILPRGLHSHLVALFLKVVSLLSSSLLLAFLFTDEAAQQNKRRSHQLLKQCTQQAPHFSLIYLQNKANIFTRIRLTLEEEKDAVNYCSPIKEEEDSKENCSVEEEEDEVKDRAVFFLPRGKKFYNSHYRNFFNREGLIDTDFYSCFTEYLSDFTFTYDTQGINFFAGIKGIRIDRFRLVHFITLYKIAKSSTINIEMYRYLLHHLLVRAKINYSSVEATLVMMLGRALLLVAENSTAFPDSPNWFDKTVESVNLAEVHLVKNDVLQEFPPIIWTYRTDLGPQENESAEEKAQENDWRENEQIWLLLTSYDLDSEKIPLELPENPSNFTLNYESYMEFNEEYKRDIVRQHYLRAAYNHSMYQFFSCVFDICDNLKFDSKMGWAVAPFVKGDIAVTLRAEEEHVAPKPGPISLEKWAVVQHPLIKLSNFFSINPLLAENNKFLFESLLEEPKNGYQRQFYRELKESWSTYLKEVKCSYSWLHAKSANELESVLQTKYREIHAQAEKTWERIAARFKERSNSESNDYFALRWLSGQVCHYHKRDILRLLIEPHQITNYNPDCLRMSDHIIQELLRYVVLEINVTKIMKVLALIEQCKRAEKEPEQFSLLQSLVKSLQENLDPASYRYPHWFLFQLENEIIVRANQQELIEAMLNQSEKVMYQLNMGEGKSSVILPLLSCNLANGKQLLRINVLSALQATMKGFLRQRFSGLIQKRVYTLPFTRDSDISIEHLELIYETLQTCQSSQHILLTTPEDRLCLQLKTRELMLENQQQMGATNIFNWKTYRQRAHTKMEVYQDMDENDVKELLKKQDQHLRNCLLSERFIDSRNYILKTPSRVPGRREFASFKKISSDSRFREWSCLKAAYRELLYNSKIGYEDSTKKLTLLNTIGAVTAIDLLDESDEILKHGTELNYTTGDKHVFDGGELRWQLPQFFVKTIFCDSEVLDIITEGKEDGFTVINLHFSSQGGVPFIQLLDENYYEDKIKPLLIDRFFQEYAPNLRKYRFRANDPLITGERSSLRLFISGKLPPDTEKKLLDVLVDKSSLKDRLLIAKGWLSHGILFHVFNAKYRVEFGLNLNSNKHVAVPFFGKDTPSPRSEFSHPDVILGFTIISYLYQGLSQEQLKKALNKLKDKFSFKVADSHLNMWVSAGQSWIKSQADFPLLSLKSFQHLDLEDTQCLEQVHKYLSGNYEAIFFYLNQFVLLEEAMQYLTKISANAHSLVGYNLALGFSGTDDRKITMPFEIKSLRSVTQEGTNGKLLSVLTQDRNSEYHSLPSEDTLDLLRKLSRLIKIQPDVTNTTCHALIDAGALVTGMSNLAVAEFFLEMLPQFLGILYFSDEGNSLTVLTRDQKTVALQDCYLDKKCLFAYLDDIHTRGTDLQLPLNCHAILTVGLGMEKDKLMQAAMRLRHLAEKQSVSLCGTQAVTLAIKRDNKLTDIGAINSREVIKWVTQNTIDHINEDLFPVAVRKINFQFLRKAEALLKMAPTALESLLQHCEEKEIVQLEDFYAFSPQYVDLAHQLLQFVNLRAETSWEELEQEMKRKQLTQTDFYAQVHESGEAAFRKLLSVICEEVTPYLQSGYARNSLNNDEEKEMEVEVEVMQEQEVVVDKKKNRREHLEIPWDVHLILRSDFVRFAEHQKIIVPLNQIQDFIQMPANLGDVIWHKDIYMTSNYILSVKFTPNERLDNFLRPVDVVLIHRSDCNSTAILLSGYEASQISLKLHQQMDFNVLTHINDINGPSQLPVGRSVSKEEQKLLTVVKLFSGECHYTSMKEVHRIAKRVGRLYPAYFTCLNVSQDVSEHIYDILIEKEYLDFAGVMTHKLFTVLKQSESKKTLLIHLPKKFQSYRRVLLKKLYGIFSRLIFVTSSPLKGSHDILKEWVGARARLKEYPGSALESVLNLEFNPKCSQ